MIEVDGLALDDETAEALLADEVFYLQQADLA